MWRETLTHYIVFSQTSRHHLQFKWMQPFNPFNPNHTGVFKSRGCCMMSPHEHGSHDVHWFQLQTKVLTWNWASFCFVGMGQHLQKSKNYARQDGFGFTFVTTSFVILRNEKETKMWKCDNFDLLCYIWNIWELPSLWDCTDSGVHCCINEYIDCFKSINQSIKFYLYSPYSQTTVCLIGL